MTSLLKTSVSCHVYTKIQTPPSDCKAPHETARHLPPPPSRSFTIQLLWLPLSPCLESCALGSRLPSSHLSWVKGLCSEKAFSGHCAQRSPDTAHCSILILYACAVSYLSLVWSLITCFPSKMLGWEEFVLLSMVPSAPSPGSGTWPRVS